VIDALVARPEMLLVLAAYFRGRRNGCFSRRKVPHHRKDLKDWNDLAAYVGIRSVWILVSQHAARPVPAAGQSASYALGNRLHGWDIAMNGISFARRTPTPDMVSVVEADSRWMRPGSLRSRQRSATCTVEL